MSPVVSHAKMSYREFAERVKADQRKAGRRVTDPEGDIQPSAYFYREETLHVVPIPFEWFSSREAKDELVARFVLMIRAGRCTMFAWSATQYQRGLDLDQLTSEQRASILERSELPQEFPMPSQDPKRIEIQGVYVHDAERYEGWAAEITRHPKRPPRYGEWWMLGDPNLGSGLMIDPIKEALR